MKDTQLVSAQGSALPSLGIFLRGNIVQPLEEGLSDTFSHKSHPGQTPFPQDTTQVFKKVTRQMDSIY